MYQTYQAIGNENGNEMSYYGLKCYLLNNLIVLIFLEMD